MVINARNMCKMTFLSDILHNLYMSTNFSENRWWQFVRKSFNGSRLVPRGQKDGPRDMKKPIVI